MNPLAWPDALWEKIKARWPHLYLADQTYDQSHIHHTLICVLIFGPLGWALAQTAEGYAHGLMAGWAFYAIREVLNRIGRWTYNLWDGILDVLVPVLITGPWALSATGAPAWAGGVLMFLLALYVAWSYTVGRPPDTLHYDPTKN